LQLPAVQTAIADDCGVVAVGLSTRITTSSIVETDALRQVETTSLSEKETMRIVPDDSKLIWVASDKMGDVPCMQVTGTWSVTGLANQPVRIVKAMLERFQPCRGERFPFVSLVQRTSALSCFLVPDADGAPTGRVRAMFFVPLPVASGEALRANTVFVDTLGNEYTHRSVYKPHASTPHLHRD
jgi:hypothetical protein